MRSPEKAVRENLMGAAGCLVIGVTLLSVSALVGYCAGPSGPSSCLGATGKSDIKFLNQSEMQGYVACMGYNVQ